MAAPLVTTHRPICFVCSLVSGVGKCEELKYFILPTFFLKSVMLTLFHLFVVITETMFFSWGSILTQVQVKAFPKKYIYIKKLVIAFDLLFNGNSKEMIYNIMKKALLLVKNTQKPRLIAFNIIHCISFCLVQDTFNRI